MLKKRAAKSKKICKMLQTLKVPTAIIKELAAIFLTVYFCINVKGYKKKNSCSNVFSTITPMSIWKILFDSGVEFYWYLKKLFVYHLKSCCAPLVVTVPRLRTTGLRYI